MQSSKNINLMRPDKDKDLIIKQNTVYVGGSLFKELVANVEAQAEAQKQQNIKDSAAAADKFGKKAKKQNKKKMIVEGVSHNFYSTFNSCYLNCTNSY